MSKKFNKIYHTMILISAGLLMSGLAAAAVLLWMEVLK